MCLFPDVLDLDLCSLPPPYLSLPLCLFPSPRCESDVPVSVLPLVCLCSLVPFPGLHGEAKVIGRRSGPFYWRQPEFA